MTKMTIAWLMVYCFGIAASFVNPVFGTLTYMFEYYLRPGIRWWGVSLPDMRWNLIASSVLTGTYLMRRGSLKEIVKACPTPGKFLVALGVLMCLISASPVAVDSARSWDLTGAYFKFILFHGLMVGTVRAIEAFDAVVGMHIFGAGWWGWEVYQNPRREQSRLYGIGSGDTLGDNKAAVHLLSVIPLIVTYALMCKNKILRGLSMVAAPFVINAFILCNSRGGLVGLVAAAGLSFLSIRPGHRLRALGAGVLVVLAFYRLADPEFITRQETISNYEQESSATARLESWQGGFHLISDYPLGAGGGGYDRLSPIYIREIVLAHDGAERAPHNTFVLVASEWGVLGLLLYLGYYLSCIRLLIHVRRTNPDGGFWYYRSVAVQTCMVGLFVGGTFTDRFYSEAPFWMGGLAVILHRLNEDRLAKEREARDGVSPPAAEEVPPLHPVAARIAAGGA